MGTKRRWAFACLAFGVLASTSSALAQQADLVTLRNGGRLRGTVEQYEPGAALVILLSDGTRRTLGVDEYDAVEFAQTPAPNGTESAIADTHEAGPSPSERRTFGDRRGASVAWENPQTDAFVTPEGPVHLGIEILGGLGLVGRVIVSGELGVDLALRLARGVNLRLVPTFRVSTDNLENDRTRRYAPLFFGGRVLFAFDIVRELALQIGGIVGGDVYTATGRSLIRVGPELDIVVPVTHDRRLQLSLDTRCEYASGQDGANTYSFDWGVAFYGGVGLEYLFL